MTTKRSPLAKHLYKVPLLFAALIILGLSLLPFLVPSKASATGQILHRALTISSGIPGKTGVSYTFTFRTVTNSQPIAGIKLIACTTATATYIGNTGSCTAPSGLHFDTASYTAGSQAGFTDTGSFAFDSTGANDCTPSASVICINRTSATNDTQTSTDKTIAFSGITNPTVVNSTFYVGIWTYSTNNYTVGSRVDSGSTASAVVQTLTTNAEVAEILNFCVGSTLIDNATVDPTSGPSNDCQTIGGTSVNLGVLDSSQVSTTPVSANCTAADCNLNGIAMLRTNAVNGAAVYYDAIQQSGSNHQGTLRISGATCNTPGNTNTDECINAAGTTQNAFTAGTEEFGMTIGGTNCGSTTSYSCSYASATEHLVPSSNYRGAAGNSYGTSSGFAWDETGTVTQIASSTTVVDDEALILKFAATPSITTPFGAYTAQSDYIAVATY
ncbi:MAG: hypothetical protein ACREGG_04270 [Candidatus Saccharimonadales bacterium]